MLSRDQIFAIDDSRIERVEVPEWGGHVYVRMLSGTERDAFEAATVTRKGKGKTETNLVNMRARLAVLCVCDESGKRLFADADATALGRKSAAALDRITDVALRLNGMTEESVEDAEGNSESAPS